MMPNFLFSPPFCVPFFKIFFFFSLFLFSFSFFIFQFSVLLIIVDMCFISLSYAKSKWLKLELLMASREFLLIPLLAYICNSVARKFVWIFTITRAYLCLLTNLVFASPLNCFFFVMCFKLLKSLVCQNLLAGDARWEEVGISWHSQVYSLDGNNAVQLEIIYYCYWILTFKSDIKLFIFVMCLMKSWYVCTS